MPQRVYSVSLISLINERKEPKEGGKRKRCHLLCKQVCLLEKEIRASKDNKSSRFPCNYANRLFFESSGQENLNAKRLPFPALNWSRFAYRRTDEVLMCGPQISAQVPVLVTKCGDIRLSFASRGVARKFFKNNATLIIIIKQFFDYFLVSKCHH